MNDGVRVARAARDDVPKILELANWAALNTVANLATEPELLTRWMSAWEEQESHYPWLVARRGEELLGFAKAQPHKPRGAYAFTADVSIYIRPDAHGQRVGTRLYASLIPLLRAQGFMTLIAGITSPNPASERLHAAAGFRLCGTFHRAGWKNGRWHDVGYWDMQLHDDAFVPRSLRRVDEVSRDIMP